MKRQSEPEPDGPVSGAPVSSSPVSGVPVSGAPVSGIPVSSGPLSWRRYSTGEFPLVRIDLAEAYAAVRRRAKSLRRRRIISAFVAVAIFSGLLTVIATYYVSRIPLPDAFALPAITTVYYNDGTTVMARLGAQNRIMVDPDRLPWHVAAATVAAEDPRFWDDSATVISRHYARAATDVDVTSPTGKARLLVMSWKLEDTYRKSEILGFYLNTVYFGRGAYGIEAAARAYFRKQSSSLTIEESIVLAGVIASPGDGRYDPSINQQAARSRFATIVEAMVAAGSLDERSALLLRMPSAAAYDPLLFQSGMDRPTGLVVARVLAELRNVPAFRDKPGGYLENGGFSIVTTIDPQAQQLLEQTADETIPGSLMDGQPDNLQAAAVVVEPGTGRVLAYYGGHDGTGADYAGWYDSAHGEVGYGAHPPGRTFDVYTLAAALRAGVSVRSRWDAPRRKEFPRSGRDAANPVRDVLTAPCQPACDLMEASVAGLNVPLYALTEQIGAAAVIDMAGAAGIDAMWVPPTGSTPSRQVTLPQRTGEPGASAPPFGTDVALGVYPVTVLDQANAMATFAAQGRRAQAHLVRTVAKGTGTVYAEALAPGVRVPVLGPDEVADLTWALSKNPAGALPDARASAVAVGAGPLRTSALETAHAWIVGYTANLAMAVWIGNEETEFPLRDSLGARVTGSGLPAEIYRAFMGVVHDRLSLPVQPFPPATFTGDAAAGDAG